MNDVHPASEVPARRSIRNVSSLESSGDPGAASYHILDSRPHTCPECHRPMVLRELRDYGPPGETVRDVVRIVRWECLCGDTEVVERKPLE